MELAVGMRVRSSEHPAEVGEVKRVTEVGYVIEWVAPASRELPYGSVNLEQWSFADAESLEVVKQQ